MAAITRRMTGDNRFTDPLDLQGDFNLSLSGDWVGTVTVQRSFDGGTTWLDVAEFTVNGEFVGNEPEPGVKYRVGVKPGDYTSGTVTGRLSQ